MGRKVTHEKTNGYQLASQSRTWFGCRRVALESWTGALRLICQGGKKVNWMLGSPPTATWDISSQNKIYCSRILQSFPTCHRPRAAKRRQCFLRRAAEPSKILGTRTNPILSSIKRAIVSLHPGTCQNDHRNWLKPSTSIQSSSESELCPLLASARQAWRQLPLYLACRMNSLSAEPIRDVHRGHAFAGISMTGREMS